MVEAPFLPVERGSGHQAPEWETWSVAREDQIKAVRLDNAVEKEEKKEKKWLPPGQIKQLAKKEGLDITDEQAEEFSRLRKEWFDRKGAVPWAAVYSLNISIVPPGKGTVTPPGGDFDAGTLVTITAYPQSGYIFDRWTGHALGTANPTTVWMVHGNKNVVAHFKKETP